MALHQGTWVDGKYAPEMVRPVGCSPCSRFTTLWLSKARRTSGDCVSGRCLSRWAPRPEATGIRAFERGGAKSIRALRIARLNTATTLLRAPVNKMTVNVPEAWY
ncbi:hypothetical protein MTO96_011995 [Rhipicephalus appendiculatus]